MNGVELQDEAERQAREGLKGPHRLWTRCTSCAQPFRFGREIDGANVYTYAGARESQISGMCESCFDETFKEE